MEDRAKALLDIPKAYEPALVEQKWYRTWEESGYFKADPSRSGVPYSIVMPPPNVTGSLHMGHALNITLQDIVIRWRRMQGLNVLWLPGTDHAGIATQNVVERQLAEQNLHRLDLGRERFEALVWEWKEKAEANILSQIRKLGSSCDWSRTRFTLDQGLSGAVREVFVRLYEAGLIYRGEYLVNWCPRCTTAISDLEVDYRPIDGKLWHIRYPLKGSNDLVVVATTRPETMLGDTAVAVHPDDERYFHLHGRKIVLPLMERDIPIITDPFVEKDFGTGVVKVTPGHDPNDFEAGQRHHLPVVRVIGEDGKMTVEAGPYSGLDRYAARNRVVQDLESKGLLAKVESHSHNVGTCQRCETVVEPLVSKQWFVRVKDLAEPAIAAVAHGRTVFIPENYSRVYFEWMRNIHDWCISRQLWWGHRIPAWYCKKCGEMIVARIEPSHCSRCKSDRMEQESDVLDTWFSSALWPFSTMGWPEATADLKVYYPTQTLITGFDIIFFWVARMMMMGLRFMNDVPFRTVYINGLIRDEQGQKMSKSRGNVIDPLQIVEEYGTDAIRFTLAVMAVPGTDIPFSVSRMAGYRAFCNKIWNAGRFLLLNLSAVPLPDAEEMDRLYSSGQLRLEERWILGRLQHAIRDTNENLEKFRFHEASNQLYHFFWHELCDWYLELIKANLAAKDKATAVLTSKVACYVMEVSLRLLHPFIPFITEELWQRLPHSGPSVMLSSYPRPKPQWIDGESIEQMEELQEVITAIRTARAETSVDPRKKIESHISCSEEAAAFLKSQEHHLRSLAQLSSVSFNAEPHGKGLRIQGMTKTVEFALILDESLDFEADRDRLRREIARLQKDVEKLGQKLQSADFLNRAPAEVVQATRQRYEDGLEQLRGLQEKLAALSGS
ncbi:MAG: valine--tRNA ligase [Acidobacteria bacterium]|nr:valine--tRNA ligase [Acidobacteriota bacterium]